MTILNVEKTAKHNVSSHNVTYTSMNFGISPDLKLIYGLPQFAPVMVVSGHEDLGYILAADILCVM